MSLKHVALAVALVGCTNPPGTVTIENHYTGACTLGFNFEEGSVTYKPLAAGETVTESIEAGLVDVRFKADGQVCTNLLCGFVGSQTTAAATCHVYTAGESIGATVTIETAMAGCPNTPPEPVPMLTCTQ
jgi:hypothetical protein